MHTARLILFPVLGFTLAACPAGDGGGARPAPARLAPAAQPAPAVRPTAALSHTVAPLWSVASGFAQARLAAVHGDRVLVLAGDYLEHGTPAKALLCLSGAEGKVLWRFTTERGPMTFVGIFSEVVFTEDREGIDIWRDLKTGAQAEAPKGLPKAMPPRPRAVAGRRCTASGAVVRCVADATGATLWETTAAGAVLGLVVTPDRVFYAVEGERAIHARRADSGLPLWRHAVHATPKVKHPERVSFSFQVAGDRLYVAHYDGLVTAHAIRTEGAPPAPAPARP